MQAIRRQQRYKVSPGNIYHCYLSYVSQTLNYFAVFFLFHCSMIIYFIVTTKENITSIIATTAVLYAVTTIIHISFPFVDPGVIPSISPNYGQAGNEAIPFDREIYRERENDYNFNVKSHFIRVRYCITCQIYRPPRTAHCRICNICIEKIDHHCPWLGICIGKRNYRLFFAFLISLTVLQIIVIFQAFEFAFQIAESADPVDWIFNVILICTTSFSTVFTLILLGFHLSIIGQNTTTNEYCLGRWLLPSGNPYQKFSCFKNIIAACCRIRQSLDDPKRQLYQRRAIKIDTEVTQNCLNEKQQGERENSSTSKKEEQSLPDEMAEIQLKTFPGPVPTQKQ